MNAVFDRSFAKSLDKLTDVTVQERIIDVIGAVEGAKSIRDVSGVKKMEGYKSFYRIRIGDYRIGIELESKDTVRFILVAHRKDIYKSFP